MHRTILAPIVFGFSLFASIARADLVCGDYLAGNYRSDEMTSSASRDLASAADTCICAGYCAPVCAAWDAENGAPQCAIGADNFYAFEGGDGITDYFTWLGGDVALCELCMSTRCGAVVDACMADGS